MNLEFSPPPGILCCSYSGVFGRQEYSYAETIIGFIDLSTCCQPSLFVGSKDHWLSIGGHKNLKSLYNSDFVQNTLNRAGN